MAAQVQITMTALNGNLSPPQRKFVLGQDCSAIPIGRASKNANKGLQGATNNAWFDSPVMSRNHAELSFDPVSKTVLINDIGSMHGTILNGISVKSNTPTQIENSDILVFGAEVKRGVESFPACTFSISHEIIAQGALEAGPLQEEGQEESVSEGEDDHAEIISPEMFHGHISQASDPIDLTRDDSPAQLIANTEAGTDHESDSEDEEASAPVRRSYGYYDEDSGEEDQQDSEDLDLDISSESGDSTDSEVDYEGYPLVAIDSDDESENESVCGLESVAGEDVASLADSDAPNLTGVFSPSDYSDSGDGDEDGLDLEQERAQGIRTLIESDLLEGTHEPSYKYSQYRSIYESESSSPVAEQRTADVALAMQPLQHVKTPLFFNSPGKIQRDPSPSDAAMAKPSDIYNAPTSQSQPATSTLDDKSGKEDFFRAREHNKATIIASNTSLFTTPGKTEPLLPGVFEMEHAVKSPQPRTYAVPCRTARINGHSSFATLTTASPTVESPFSVSFAPPAISSLLDTPDQVPITMRRPNQSFDMTSAVTFNASKGNSTQTEQNPIPPPHIARSGLRIDEIIENSASEPTVNKLKRKSDEISSAVEEEVRIWGSSTTKRTRAMQILPVTRRSLQQPASNRNLTRFSEQRPRKRLRKIMETVAYIAVGGVAAFGALVATAPDLL